MNINNVEILKTILIEQPESIYKLAQSLKSKGANYTTLLRHVFKLRDEGFIQIRESKTDLRETKALDITLKGLFKLILDADLSDENLRSFVRKMFLKMSPKAPVFVNYDLLLSFPANALRKSFETLKPMINLDYYNEDHAQSLFLNTVNDLFLNEWSKPHSELFSPLAYKKVRRQAENFLRSRTPEEIERLSMLCETLEKQKKDLEAKLKIVRQVIAHTQQK